MLTASNSNGTYAFTYDTSGRLTQVTEPFGLTLNYAYDGAGNQTQVIDSLGGTVASTYDGSNFLTERTYSGQSLALRIDFVNNKEGQPTTETSYSDLAGTSLVATTDIGYNGAGVITSVASYNASSVLIDSFVYSLDSHSNVTKVVETQSGTTTTTSYTYDSGGQLTNDGTAYGYDSTGNRNTGSDTVTTGNQMSADANWTYTYDKEGNLKEKDSTAGGSHDHWIYVYSANNLLTEARHYSFSGVLASTVDYKYDAFGEEIEQDVTPAGSGTTTTKFAYDGWNPNMPAGVGNANFIQWAVLNSGNTLQTRNINGNMPGQHLARVDQTGASDPSGVYFLPSDRLGSVRDVINPSGTVKDSLAYDGFGNIKAGEVDSTYRGWYAWTGQEFDVQTNLQYNNARWYDASTGRWISQDPMGFDAGDSNLYRYVNNQPTSGTDPSGLQPGGQLDAIIKHYAEDPNKDPAKWYKDDRNFSEQAYVFAPLRVPIPHALTMGRSIDSSGVFLYEAGENKKLFGTIFYQDGMNYGLFTINDSILTGSFNIPTVEGGKVTKNNFVTLGKDGMGFSVALGNQSVSAAKGRLNSGTIEGKNEAGDTVALNIQADKITGSVKLFKKMQSIKFDLNDTKTLEGLPPIPVLKMDGGWELNLKNLSKGEIGLGLNPGMPGSGYQITFDKTGKFNFNIPAGKSGLDFSYGNLSNKQSFKLAFETSSKAKFEFSAMQAGTLSVKAMFPFALKGIDGAFGSELRKDGKVTTLLFNLGFKF